MQYQRLSTATRVDDVSIESLQQFSDGLSKLAAFSACQPNKAAALPKEVYPGSIPDFSSAARLASSLRGFAQSQQNSLPLMDAVEKAAAQAGLVVLRKPEVTAASANMFRRKNDSNEPANPGSHSESREDRFHTASRG